jgi:hypothetical protein
MPNKFHAKTGAGSPPPTGVRGPTPKTLNEKTAAWPGLPGKSQPKNRSGGTKKIVQHPKSEGI